MNFGAWGTVHVRDAADAAARAAAGAAYLDARLEPGWDRHLDLVRLDIASPLTCVLAQVNRRKAWSAIPGLTMCVAGGFSVGLWGDMASLVWKTRATRRSFDLLNDAWRALLLARRVGPLSEPAIASRRESAGKASSVAVSA